MVGAQANDFISLNPDEYFSKQCNYAFHSMGEELQTEFQKRKLARSVPLALSTMWQNRAAFPAIDMALYPGQTIEPAPITFKRALIVLLDDNASFNHPDTGIPRIAPSSLEPLINVAERELRSLFGSSDTLRMFLESYLSQAQDITLVGDDGVERTISRFRPYRYEERPEGMKSIVREHIELYEWGFMESADGIFPHDPSIEDPDYDEIKSATYVFKAICGWLWERIVDSQEGEQALALHLPTRAGAIRNVLNLAESSDSISFKIGLQLITSPSQAVIIGTYYCCDNAIDESLTKDELRFLLECDYDQIPEKQRLLLVKSPTPENMRIMLRDTGVSLENLCLKTALQFIPGITDLDSGTKQNFPLVLKEYTNRKDRQAALEAIADDENLPELRSLPVFRQVLGSLPPKVVQLSDFIINTAISNSGTSGKVVVQATSYPPGIEALEKFETARLSNKPNLTNIESRNIEDLVSAALVIDHSTEDDVALAQQEYPFKVSCDYLVVKEAKTAPRELISETKRLIKGFGVSI